VRRAARSRAQAASAVSHGSWIASHVAPAAVAASVTNARRVASRRVASRRVV